MGLGLKHFLLLLVFITTSASYAGKIDKGYEALYQYDYFKAKKFFTKGLKYNTAAAAQGLALIHFREDNPFHSYDSALVYVQLANDRWFVTNERRRLLFEKYGFTEDSILSLRQHISSKFYSNAVSANTVASFSNFALNHPWANEKERAIEIRDSLAFFIAVSENSPDSYKRYVDNYPTSEFSSLAFENYNNSVYDEVTSSNSLASYLEFVNLYPENPNKGEAERHIYRIITDSNTEEAFAKFIQTYPESAYIDTAWLEMYQAYLSEYSKERIGAFLETYPGMPFPEMVYEDLGVAEIIFLPYMNENEVGYMKVNGEKLYSTPYNSVGVFDEGLAPVSMNGRYGFINKRMEIQIPNIYESVSEYLNGRSVVELNGKFGLIDRNGRYIIPCKYEDLGIMSEDLAYAETGGKFGYYDNSGKLRIDHMFDDAYDFNEGTAKVEFEGKQGYVDIYGGFVVPPAYKRIEPYFDTLYLFEEDGLFGLMNHRCQIYQEPIFREIGQFADGLVIAEMKATKEVVYLDSAAHIIVRDGFETYPNYLLKGEFHNGVAVVMKEGKYGRIDVNGVVLTEFKYDNIGIGSTLFAFEKEGLWGVLNASNEVIISPLYKSLNIIKSKYMIANKNDTLGILNTAGNIIVPFAFNNIDAIVDELFIVTDSEGKGLYHGGNRVVGPHFSEIGLFNEDYLYLISDGGVSYYDIHNRKLIQYKEQSE